MTRILVVLVISLGLAVLTKLRSNGQGEAELSSRRTDNLDAITTGIQTGRLKSIEDVLAFLSPEMRQNHVLLFDSRSTQKSQPLKPRAVVFDESASLIVGFTDKDLVGGDRLEIMQFRESSKRYEFTEITASTSGLHVSDINPRRCTRCHTEAYIPNWASYQKWTGAYGESANNFKDYTRVDWTGDDGPNKRKMFIREEEFNNFLNFKKKAVMDPRYSLLQSPPEEPLWPFGKSAVNLNLRGDEIARYAPNRRFGILLNFRMGQMLARRISETTVYRTIPNTILFSLLGCAEISTRRGEEGNSPYNSLKKELESRFNPRDDRSLPRSLLLERLVLQIKTGEWSIDHFLRDEPESQLSSFTEYSLFNSGFYEMDTSHEVAGVALLSSQSRFNHLFPKDVDAIERMGVNASVAKTIFSEVPYVSYATIESKICPLLYAEAKIETEGSRAVDRAWQAIGTSPTRFPRILNKCVGCHVNDPDTDTPYIPFDRPVEFKSLLRKNAGAHGTWLQEFQYRLDPTTPHDQQMPPDDSSLKSDRRQGARQNLQFKILNYLNDLSR